MTIFTDEHTARCISVTSGDGRWTASGGYLGGGWAVIDNRTHCVVKTYEPEPGLDASGVLVRWWSQYQEMKRAMIE